VSELAEVFDPETNVHAAIDARALPQFLAAGWRQVFTPEPGNFPSEVNENGPLSTPTREGVLRREGRRNRTAGAAPVSG